MPPRRSDLGVASGARERAAAISAENVQRTFSASGRHEGGTRDAWVSAEAFTMKRWAWFLSLAIAGVAMTASAAVAYADEKGEENEKEVKLDAIPAPARETILREAGGSPILKVEEETMNGATVYEAHVQKGNDVLGIRVDPNGKLIDKHSEKGE
jgi:hypothetical protein